MNNTAVTFLRVRRIKEQNGYYVGDNGKVFSIWENKGRHGVQKGKLKELSGSKSKSGHLYIRFGREGKTELIHRLVFRTFKGELEQGKVIRHLNDEPSDNRVENLEQGSQKENMSDALKNKRLKTKLTEKDVSEIRKLVKKFTHQEVAEMSGVSRQNISEIAKNKVWGHVL